MAGGAGVRFWPLSRNSKPKQFHDILGIGKSFLQMTYERFAKILPPENIIVVTSRQHADLVMEQLPQISPERVLREPYRRNTAPCVAYATYKLLAENPNATVVVTPSDHLITDDDLFASTLLNGLQFAEGSDKLITLGITPHRAEGSYGYIQANKGESISLNGSVAYPVKTFTEKPGAELAEVFVKSGEFLWNSGVFIWSLKSIIGEFELHQKGMATLFSEGRELYNTPGEELFINRVYEECQSISVDYAIMEKTEKAIVYPASFGWADIGTWEALYSFHEKDENENLVGSGKSLLREVTNSIVISENRGKLLVVSELDNYMVVDTDDLLLICPKDDVSYQNLFAELPLKGFKRFQ